MALSNGEPPIPVDADGMPFESISLTNSPPLHAASIPLSPTTTHTKELRMKRTSWSGASRHHTSGSSASLSGRGAERRHSTAVDLAQENGEVETEQITSREAPPAHPHPYTLPTQSSRTSITSPRPSTDRPPAAIPGANPTSTFKPLKSGKGPSTLSQVISHTRPSYLPPKNRTEDEVHLHQWEVMMNSAKEAEQLKQHEAEVRRLEKEKRLAMSVHAWERLMSEGETGIANIRRGKSPELRRMWFEGIPGHLRGKAWSLAIGNPLALSKGEIHW
jgi:hypothetical protein